MKKKKLFYLTQIFAEPEDNNNENDNQDNQDGKDGNTEKKYTDADLDKIIGAKFAKWQKEQEKKISEAERLAKMSEADRTKAERDALQKELDDLKRANSLAQMHTEARKLLAADEITIDDELVDILVTDDADKTKAAVTAFAKAYKEAVQDGVKAALKGKTPARGGGSGTLTKADILKVEDPLERQKLIAENIKLFK
jgi:hypothetical protein